MAGGSSTRFLSEAHGRVGRWLRNKWHLDSLIAIGGMAAVYASTHRNGARAAIKLLHSQYTRNEQARRRFLAEGYAANKVGHRNAVLVLDDDTTEDGEVYLVMELLEGESLEGRLERLGVMSPMEVLHVADQLLEVLACAHPKGILHRDIKPANIYLTRDGSVKLLDFGLARVRELSAEALDQSDGIVFGTVSYIAPEQARADNQNLDSRSDMWSIAATMFRALAGETVHPSTGPIIERLLAVARKPARSLASLAPHLPRPVIELVDRALAFDPEDRWPSANVMRVVVQDVMAQLQEEAESEELDIEIQQPAPSRRTNTLPVTTRARTLDLPTVRAGAGPAAAESGVKRPKTDPVGLSHRPRNLPPSEPAPPDGDETELDLDGLYDKAKAAVPTNPGRSRTLLTKEGRAELRRILDARKAGATAPEPEPAPAPAPAPERGRRVAGPDVSGVGDIEVEFEDSNAEDSIIEVTIDHMHGSRSGPIAERISEPSSATPAPVPLEAPVAQSLAAATTMPAAAVLEIDDPGASGSGAATPRSARSESYPAISVEEDTEEEAEAEEDDEAFASPAPPSAASKPTSNLRPPSVPPQQPVPSDSRAASPRSATPQPPANMTRATGRAPQTEITRVGPPPRPASSERPPASPVSSESRPAASNEARPLAPTVAAREITKVGPAPVAPLAPLAAAPPAQESPRPAPRANAGLLHDTMRASTPVTPPARGSKDEPRKSTNAGLLNETLRPGAAPPPAQARSGPIPAARVEGEPARSTTFSAPVRPGSDAHASTHARATNFVPPAGRASIATSAVPAAATPTTPVTASTSPVSPTSPPGASTTLRLPTAAPRPTSQPSASVTATDVADAASKAATSVADAASKAVTSVADAASRAATSVADAASRAATSVADATSRAATSVADATSKAATPAASAAIASKAAPAAAAPNKAATPAAGNIAATPTKAAAPDPTAKPAGTAAQAAPGPASAAQPATRPTGAPAPVVPAASGPVPVVPTVSVPIVPTISVPVVPTVPVPVVPARSTPVASPAPPPERAPEVVATPEPSPRAAARSMFNPYPSLAGGARPEGSATAKTASYATIPAATGKDGAVVSPNPRTSPNARTAPHPVADAAVPKDSTPAPKDSPGPRTGSPTAKTAAYATLSPEDTRGKSGAGPLLPFNFLRGASKPGEAGEPTPPDDPKNPARKKP